MEHVVYNRFTHIYEIGRKPWATQTRAAFSCLQNLYHVYQARCCQRWCAERSHAFTHSRQKHFKQLLLVALKKEHAVLHHVNKSSGANAAQRNSILTIKSEVRTCPSERHVAVWRVGLFSRSYAYGSCGRVQIFLSRRFVQHKIMRHGGAQPPELCRERTTWLTACLPNVPSWHCTSAALHLRDMAWRAVRNGEEDIRVPGMENVLVRAVQRLQDKVKYQVK